MGKNGRIGIVTVTFNSAAVIQDFMDSVLKQTYIDFILYVVDNASSDQTLRQVSGFRDSRFVLVQNAINVGVAEGNNIGIRAALRDGCDSVLLVNNDTVFDGDLCAELNAALRQYECDMVVPKITYFDRPQTIWCAGGFFRFRGFSCRHFGIDRQDSNEFDSPRTIDYSPTCCMLIRREVFEDVGLMDSSYFVYYDDTDFCFRANRAGKKLVYVPSVRLLHKVSSLSGKDSDFFVHYGVRNHVYYFLKHFPRWRLLLLAAYQVYLVAKFLVLRRGQNICLAEKAFWEGISLFYSQGEKLRASV